MNFRTVFKTTACALVVSLPALVAQAHQGEPHANKPAIVKKEQKPWGIAGSAKATGGASRRTIEITMGDDMRFAPDRIEVRQGETVKLVIRNRGQQLHEFVLGTKGELDAHAALMLKFPNMEHDEPYMAHVAPGKAGEIVWTFNRTGDFDFACLIAGHYQAGMVGKIKVLAARPAGTAMAAAMVVAVADTSQASGTELTEGEVRKIDKEAGKLTLRHGPIKNLDMPAMTMVFSVKDKALLDPLQAGDKVRFRVVNEGGKFTVTQIEPAK